LLAVVDGLGSGETVVSHVIGEGRPAGNFTVSLMPVAKLLFPPSVPRSVMPPVLFQIKRVLVLCKG
jgi:hypothetical protein